MINPGEYPQPLIRETHVQCPIVGGYITARLQVQGNPVLSTTALFTGSGYVDNTTMVTVENTGLNTFTMQLLGVNSISGLRENVGAAKTLVPQGRTVFSVVPRHTFLEVKGITGTSALRMQLSSRLRWDRLGHSKTDPYYPPSLFQAKSPLTTAV